MRTEVSNPKALIILLIFLSPLSGFGIDIFVPSLPAIEQFFNTTTNAAQHCISFYLLGFGFFQLVWGTLSDIYGRKYLLILCLTLFVISSAYIPYSHTINELLLMRFIQGLSIAGSSVIGRSIIADCFSGKQLRHITTNYTLAWALGPIIAPVIGGYLQVYLGWQASFHFLTLYGLIALIAVLCTLKETHFNRTPAKISLVYHNYKTILTHKEFWGATLCLAAVYSFMTIFNVAGPFIIEVNLGFSAIQYGHIALLLGVAWTLGNAINKFFIARNFHHQKIFLNTSMIITIVAFIMVGLASLLPLSLLLVIVPTLILFVGGSLILTNAYAICLQLFPNNAGIASAIMGGFFITGAGIVTGIAGILETESFLPFALSYAVLAFINLGAYLLFMHPKK